MKNRSLYNELVKQIDHKNALLITGLRQVGKTTLMMSLFKQAQMPKIWFDFDNPLDQKYFENDDYNQIYQRLKIDTSAKDKRFLVCIDEIQNYPPVTRIIKYLIDHFQVKFILTGSSNFYLRNLFPESLSGRKFLYHLSPLSFKEYLYFNDVISHNEVIQFEPIETIKNINNYVQYKKREHLYDQYLEFGGFPEVVTTSDKDTKKLILKNIFASFFEKDLRILSDYKDIRELRDLILLLAPRSCSVLDVTKLASELGIDRIKVYHYLEFLQGIFFIKLLPRFSKSIDKSVAGGRKVFFADTGLLQLLGKIPDGQVFENAVVNQLAEYGSLSFYRYRNTSELDVIIDNKYGFEIKTTGTVSDVKHVGKLKEKIGLQECKVISKKYIDETYVYPHFL
jgi:predicted AAA+ superfamily ATPase